MDSTFLDVLLWCLNFGIILLSGCHATHNRRSSLHMDHVWRAVNVSVESPGPFFVVQPSETNPVPSNILQRPLYLGYPELAPSVLYTSYGPFQARQSLLVSEAESNAKFFVRADIVDRVVRRDTPGIRVLFHLQRHHGVSLTPDRHRTRTCLKAEVEYLGMTSVGYCAPKGNPPSCLAEIEVLLAWRGNATAVLNLTYAILPQSESSRCTSRGSSDPWGAEPDGILGEFLGSVVLNDDSDGDYKRVTEDRLVHLEMPKRALGINERFEVPIMVNRLFLCTLRARMKGGIKLTKIKYLDPVMAGEWSMVRSKGTLGMATAEKHQGAALEESGDDEMPVVMSMVFEILNQTTPERQVSWRVDCANGQDKFASQFVTVVTGSQEWLKEFFPVIKSTDIVNTAVLGSGRVHYPLRVLAVSHASDISMVTDEAQCISSNSNIVKVEPDCSSVFLNGSESDGAEQVPINVTFQGSSMTLPLRVWMPELPLTVSLSDERLSVVKRWKVAREAGDAPSKDENGAGKDKDHVACQLTYQTAIIDVLTRFYVPLADEAGGRRYFSGPDARQMITDLVVRHLKVHDHRVATLDGRRVTGLEPGTTAVQVVHPHTKEVLGRKKLHVLTDKVEVVRMKVTMVTGMSLTFGSIDTENNIFGFNLMALEGFIAQHQEAFLYTTITYDDLTTVALQDLDPATYSLVVTSSRNQVIAVSPDSSPALPSIITTGQGSTELTVSFLPARECQRKRKENCIASDSSRVDVAYNSSHPLLNEVVTGNHGEPWMRFSPGVRFVDPGVVRTDVSPDYVRQLPPAETNDCGAQITSIPIDWGDDAGGGLFPPPKANRNQTLALDHSGDGPEDDQPPPKKSLTALEIILYVVLAIFGIAVLLFIVNFLVVIARYFRRKKPALSDGIHPQSWIALGVDWNKQGRRQGEGEFPLPSSDESFHLQESMEGSSGREDMSSTVSGPSMPRPLGGAYSENEEPQEVDPLLLQRLNNGAIVRERGLPPNGNSRRTTTYGHGHPHREPLEASPDVRWNDDDESHEMEPLGGARTSVEIVDESHRREPRQQTGGESADSFGDPQGCMPGHEDISPRPTHDDFVLRELGVMKETAT